MSKGGREEKRVEAHEGAVICIRWNFEGLLISHLALNNSLMN